MKVVILHPDFGIGGAERLVLDSALALKQRGHQIKIVTNQFSENHSFEELKEFKEDLLTVAQNFPRSIFGKCSALCAYIRFCIAALFVCVKHRDADVIFSDQISAPLPILRLFGGGAALLFYCHYPDQLLASKRETVWKRLYRFVIDRIEAWTMCWADQILVNSQFTNGVVQKTFPALVNLRPALLYPSINCEFFDKTVEEFTSRSGLDKIATELGSPLIELLKSENTVTFLSVNRFERKKNLELAIRAFDHFCKNSAVASKQNFVLVLAGGYDPLNRENIEHFEELVKLTKQFGIEEQVEFVKSPSDSSKIWLLSIARLVLYTPDLEHFGIVPIEAMFLSTPVLAVNSGGPKETVLHEKTGFLCSLDPEKFAQFMAVAANEPERLKEMGIEGRKHVEANFSFDSFSEKLNKIVCLLAEKKKKNSDRKQIKEE